MKNLESIITRLFPNLRKKEAKKFVAPEELPEETMAKIMVEIDFLRQNHGVDVQNLAEGETPTDPQPAQK
jgi:hypothetical protein